MRHVKAIVDVAGFELTEQDKRFLKHPCIAGVILFSRNYKSKAQLYALTQSLREINHEFIICIDQEGGRVQRLREGFTPLQAMSCFGKQYLTDPDKAQHALRQQLITMINELYDVGITTTLMPVVDLDYGRSLIIGERSFGKTPEVVISLAQVVVDTLHEYGMPVTLKHFPGHGFVKADSHVALPSDERSFDTIKNNDMLPFIHLLPKADFVMPAHIVFPQVDQQPVGFSPYWLKNILRKQLSFQGSVISDDLSMQAAASIGDYSARAQAAIDAGCDFLLVCNHRDGAMDVVNTLETGETVWQQSM